MPWEENGVRGGRGQSIARKIIGEEKLLPKRDYEEKVRPHTPATFNVPACGAVAGRRHTELTKPRSLHGGSRRGGVSRTHPRETYCPTREPRSYAPARKTELPPAARPHKTALPSLRAASIALSEAANLRVPAKSVRYQNDAHHKVNRRSSRKTPSCHRQRDRRRLGVGSGTVSHPFAGAERTTPMAWQAEGDDA
jgi:hypothetical protein